MTRSEFKTTSQNTVEPPNTTRHTVNITTSVLVGVRCVTSASSTPNGSIHVTNVVATPYATSAAANRLVAMPASRAIDQRRPVASGPPRGTPLLAAAPTSWIVRALAMVVAPSSRRRMSARATRSTTPSRISAPTTATGIDRISASAEPIVSLWDQIAAPKPTPATANRPVRTWSVEGRLATTANVGVDETGRSIVPPDSFCPA